MTLDVCVTLVACGADTGVDGSTEDVTSTCEGRQTNTNTEVNVACES